MPVFSLSDKIIFPPPHLADDDGLLAVGGDLTRERIIKAYSMGIFPWYSYGSPILWWSPDPRLILMPARFRVSRSLDRTIRKGTFSVTMDKDFRSVIRSCSSVSRKHEKGTWITEEMINAYTELHESGYAHSVEARYEGRLVGGLYGVSLGSVFFGESMFSLMSNASKVALAVLVRQLVEWDYSLIDCQVYTPHLKSLGACEVPRRDFLVMLQKGLEKPKKPGKWSLQA